MRTAWAWTAPAGIVVVAVTLAQRMLSPDGAHTWRRPREACAEAWLGGAGSPTAARSRGRDGVPARRSGATSRGQRRVAIGRAGEQTARRTRPPTPPAACRAATTASSRRDVVGACGGQRQHGEDAEEQHVSRACSRRDRGGCAAAGIGRHGQAPAESGATFAPRHLTGCDCILDTLFPHSRGRWSPWARRHGMPRSLAAPAGVFE